MPPFPGELPCHVNICIFSFDLCNEGFPLLYCQRLPDFFSASGSTAASKSRALSWNVSDSPMDAAVRHQLLMVYSRPHALMSKQSTIPHLSCFVGLILFVFVSRTEYGSDRRSP